VAQIDIVILGVHSLAHPKDGVGLPPLVEICLVHHRRLFCRGCSFRDLDLNTMSVIQLTHRNVSKPQVVLYVYDCPSGQVFFYRGVSYSEREVDGVVYKEVVVRGEGG
jgi:hypothetical protein